jgi:hypothetical protein
MAIDNANLTDYVSLRRLKEYHDLVVKKAIENAGTIKTIKIGTAALPINDGAVTLPEVSINSSGLMTAKNFSDLSLAAKSISISNTATTPSLSMGTLTLPLASVNAATAGLISNDDYRLFKGLAEAVDDPNAIDSLYEVFKFLEGYQDDVTLATYLNKKANLENISDDPLNPTTNIFEIVNTFKNNVNFTGTNANTKINVTLTNANLTADTGVVLDLVNASNDSKLPASAKYCLDSKGEVYYSYLPLGTNTGTHGFKFNASGSIYSYYLPGLSNDNIVDTSESGNLRYRYLTTVMCFDNDVNDPQCVISKSHLRECPPITNAMFA